MDGSNGPDRSGERETALLVAVQLPGQSEEQTEDSLSELAALADTAGADVAASMVQRRAHYKPDTMLGSGKVQEAAEMVRAHEADLAIFDNELSVGQQDRLEEALGTRVIDRTALILDIFAQHAHTREGSTQVELAQLTYMLPRIRGKGLEMSRMAGGIGTRRGPGETKLEVDRRRIRRRIRKLEGDLQQMEAVRLTQRKQRVRAGLPSVCLVGYTNSGKSTLLHRLTGASVLIEDRLFSTLDSTTRALVLPGGQRMVLSDTVGFIRKLPHELIAAFHSTLEVVRDADLLVHVAEATREAHLDERLQAVKAVLDEIGAAAIPMVVVLNKVDLIELGQRRALAGRYGDAVLASATTGEGIEELVSRIEQAISDRAEIELLVPASRGDVISSAYRDGVVTESELQGDSMLLRVRMPRDASGKYSEYMVQNLPNDQ